MPGKMSQISPSTTVRAARGDGSRPHLASVLQEGRKSPNIQARLGTIWGIPLKEFNARLEGAGPSCGLRNLT